MSMRWFYVYPRLTPLVGCFYVYGVFLHLSHTDLASVAFLYMFFVSVPGLGGAVGSWCHHMLSVCSLCLCQALVVVWGPCVITGSLCVLCVCARPWWWRVVLASSQADVCSLCLCQAWWWCGVPVSSQADVCSLCLCQALVVACGPGVITG